MASKLEFILRLVDRASGPARSIGRSVGAVDRALDLVGRRSASAGRSIAGAFRSSQGAANALGRSLRHVGDVATASFSRSSAQARVFRQTLSGIGAAATSLPALLAGVGLGAAGAQVLGGMSFKESNLTSLRVLLRDTKLASETFQKANKFANVTPFQTDEVITATKYLVTSGYKVDDIFKSVLRNAGDAASAANVPLEQSVRAFQALKQGDFGEAFGVGQGFNQLGISRKDLEGEGLVFDKQGSYKGSVEKAMDVVNRIIERKFGGTMNEQSKAIGGMWSTITSAPQTIFFNLVPDDNKQLAANPKKFAGFTALKKTLSKMTDLLNPEKAIGKKVFDKLEGFLNTSLAKVFTGMGDALTPANVGAAMDKLIAISNRILSWWERNGPTVVSYATQFGKGIGDAFNQAKAAWDTVKPLAMWLGELAGKLLGVKDAQSGAGGSATRFMGNLLGVAGALALLNFLTFGATGAVGGLALAMMGNGIKSAVAYSGSLLGAAWASRAVGLSALAAGAQVAMGWLIALGPIGWLVLAVVGVVAALVLAYNKVEWFRDGVNAAWDAIYNAVFDTMTWFEELPAKMQSFGMNLMQGLANGILSGVTVAKDALKSAADSVINGWKALLGIHSPSRVFAGLGQMLPAGLAVGIDDGATPVLRSLKALGAAATVTMATTAAPAMAAPTVTAPAARTATTAGQRAPIAIHVTVPVQGASGGKVDTAAIEAAVKNAMSSVMGELEMLLMEDGYDG